MMPAITDAPARVRFADHGAFSAELKTRADAYFDSHHDERRDVARMYAKSAVILTWFSGSWALLVFAATTWWEGAALAVSLGLSIAAIGMSVMHDANHSAYSKRPWINRAFGSTLDLMGVNSFIWRYKHNTLHHTFTNVEGVDYDLDFGLLARLTPGQTRRRWHRFQHLYLWFFYGFLLPKWVFHDDFVIWRSRHIGSHPMPRPSRTDSGMFVLWKLVFIAWALVIPALYHPILQVLAFHFIAVFTLGVTLGTTFQLAHCLDEAEFPHPPLAGARLGNDWASHQLETTVDFAAGNGLVTWFCGGLNFQVEHHLFPRVCHVHYPALSRIVSEVSAKHGLQHRKNVTLRDAIRSHFQHLRRLGLKPLALPLPIPLPIPAV
jgi:linoleoyl-CoA desaturase